MGRLENLFIVGSIAGALTVGGCEAKWQKQYRERKEEIIRLVDDDMAYFSDGLEGTRFSRKDVQSLREGRYDPRGLEKYPEEMSIYDANFFRSKKISPEVAAKIQSRFYDDAPLIELMLAKNFSPEQINLFPERFNSWDLRRLVESGIGPETIAAYPESYNYYQLLDALKLGLTPSAARNYAEIEWDKQYKFDEWSADSGIRVTRLSPRETDRCRKFGISVEELRKAAEANRKYGRMLSPTAYINLRELGLSEEEIEGRMRETRINELMKR